MHYDEILVQIGEFGRYQKIKYGLVCFGFATVSWQTMISAFSIYTPPHRAFHDSGDGNHYPGLVQLKLRHMCQVPSEALGNFADSWRNQSVEHQLLVDEFIPVSEDGEYSKCEVYITPKLSANHTPEVRQCDSWVYDDTEMNATVVTRMNLVCSRQLYGTLATSVFMLGNLIGSVVCGFLSDIFGRKRAFLIGIGGQIASGIGLAFTPEYYSFTVFRFMAGVFNAMILLSSYVLGMEMVGPSKRVTVGIIILVCWALGFIVLDISAYFIRIDKYMQLAITLPSLLCVSYQWILPESPRWLLAKKRIKEAEDLIYKIAHVNGTTVPEDMELELEQVKPAESIKELFRAPTLLCRTAIIFFNWFASIIAFFGISLNSGNLPGSLYANLLFTAASEMIGYLLCFLCLILGRKAPFVVGMCMGGLASISSIGVYYGMTVEDQEQSRNVIFIVLSNISKVGVTTGFGVIFLWSAEIFPTVLRTSLLGLGSTSGRIGAIISPYIADIGKVMPPQYSQLLPPLTFGLLTLTGGLLSIALPETAGCELPETIAEANAFPEKLELSTEEEKFQQPV